ncbi:hypothetical protein GGI43DRAFT_389463 [Trichoderma evansii]
MQMASSEPSNFVVQRHMHIHPQCSACNTLFLPDDNIVALLYDGKIILAKDTVAARWNRYMKQPRPEDVYFCDEPAKKTCYAGDESVAVHADCLSLFGKICSAKDKYRRLWIAGTRMYPWREAVPLMLDPVLCAPTEIISSAAGFHKTFLPEVASVIGGYLQLDHPLLRFCKVLQLAQHLSSAESGSAVTYPLCEVLSWSRGTSPILIEQGQTVDPRVRLTIDSRGIKIIERVSDSSRERTSIGLPIPSRAYIIESVERLAGVSIEYQLGMSRLHIPTSVNISIWNIPTPHALPSLAHNTPLDKPLSGRFEALSLDPDYTTGVSFFLLNGKIMAIHGHTKQGSQALQAFQYLCRFHHMFPNWIYIPISTKDKVITIGTVRAKLQLRELPGRRMPPMISYSIVLTLKSGKYFIGYPSNSPTTKTNETLYEMQQPDHPTLIYDVVNRSFIWFIGAGMIGEPASGIETDTKYPNDPRIYLYNSYAPLERVVKAHVFTDNEADRCRGILLEYEDGMKRALGQCRLGFDHAQCYENPTTFCYLPVKSLFKENLGYHDKGIQVTFDSKTGPFEEQDTAKWEICPMKGTLQFGLTHLETIVKIHDAQEPSI